MMLASSSLSKLEVRYNGEIAYSFRNIDDIHAVTSKCEYLNSLVHRWIVDHRESNDDDSNDSIANGNGNDVVVHEIPQLESVETIGVRTVLEALDKNALTSEMMMVVEMPTSATGKNEETTRRNNKHKAPPPPLDEQLLEISFYLGCEDFILPRYCDVSAPAHRLRAAYFLCQRGQQQKELECLLMCNNTYSFFRGFDRSMIPLCKEFCSSVNLVRILLGAYQNAPEQGLLGKTRGIFGSVAKIFSPCKSSNSDESLIMMPTLLRIEQFGMFVIQKFYDADWTEQDLDMIFSILPPTPEGYKKPVGLEMFVTRAILMQKEIPSTLRNWNIDTALIAPALFDAGRLQDAPLYSDSQKLVRTIVDSWTCQDCVKALEKDREGIRKLFEIGVTDENCGWLAAIPIFGEARAHSRGTVQRLLYRRLFLHTHFDPELSPLLVSCLPIGSNSAMRARALDHAVQYLEETNVRHAAAIQEVEILPWEEASAQLTQRAAAALANHHGDGGEDDNSSLELWKRLDIPKLRGTQFLDHVPARILSQRAYEEACRANDDLRNSQLQIQRLENHVEKLEGTVKVLKEELRRLSREQARR